MQPTITLRRSGLTWRHVGGEVVALDLGSARYFTANASGSVLWETLVRGTTRSELATVLRETYGLDGDRAFADVEKFLNTLSSYGMLTTDAGSTTTG